MLFCVMTSTQQQQIECIKLQLRTLRRIAENAADFEDACAIEFAADGIAEALELMELDAAPACEDESLIAA
jgi:hypothetical protein